MTDVEWAIMDALWELEPCAAGSIQEALQEQHGWAYSTVKTTMDRMVAKGLLTTKSIRNLTLYSSLVSREAARRTELKQCLRRAFDGALTPTTNNSLGSSTIPSESELCALGGAVLTGTGAGPHNAAITIP